jgi:hypothetical protein
MKFLKTLGLGLLGLIALLLIAAFFIPNDYIVSVSTTINQPKQVVYDYVKILKNQENYSVWVMEDPNLKPVITGIDGTVGAKQSWNSLDDNIGEGDQTISRMNADSICVDLHFVRPIEGKNKAATIFTAIDSTHTKVTSDFYGHSAYPMNLTNWIGAKFIKDSEVQNLANLKAILEK